jgi:hypothetical protein
MKMILVSFKSLYTNCAYFFIVMVRERESKSGRGKRILLEIGD